MSETGRMYDPEYRVVFISNEVLDTMQRVNPILYNRAIENRWMIEVKEKREPSSGWRYYGLARTEAQARDRIYRITGSDSATEGRHEPGMPGPSSDI